MKNAIWTVGGTLVVGLLAGTYLSGLAGGQAVTFGPAGTATLIGAERGVTVNGIPTPQQMMRVVEGTPFTVPAGKLFVATGIANSESRLSTELLIQVLFDGVNVLNERTTDDPSRFAHNTIAIPPGLTAAAGQRVEVVAFISGVGSQGTGVLLGYLVDA